LLVGDIKDNDTIVADRVDDTIKLTVPKVAPVPEKVAV